MADGVPITPGTGTTVSSDEVTTVDGVVVTARHAQDIKIDVEGVDGAVRRLGPNFPMPTQLSGITFKPAPTNSSSVQLAAGATFTGAIEATFNQPAAQVMVFSDQPFTVHVDQFNDQSNLISTDSFVRLAGQALNENVQVNGDFVRIRVVNNGTAATTTLRVETTYGPLNPLPRALTSAGNLKVVNNENGIVSPTGTNTTFTNLGANAVFTGTAEDVSEYSQIKVAVFSSHASALNGLQLQQSATGNVGEWDFVDTYTIPAASGKSFGAAVTAKFYRLVYTNGATATTSLRISTMYSKTIKKGSAVRPQDGRANDNDFEEMLAHGMHYDLATDQWNRQRGTIAGGLAVDASADKYATFKGRATSFRTPGRAGTTGQKIFAIYNPTGSGKILKVGKVSVDLTATVAKALTVLPPIIRIGRYTIASTGGSLLNKTAKDTALTSNANISAFGDASADGTSSGSALAITTTNNWFAQEFVPRIFTGAGVEIFDRSSFLEDEGVTIRAGEGLVVFLDYVLATQNPATDMWIVTCDWYELNP